MTVTTCFQVIALRGNHPPAPTCLRLELSSIPVGPCRLSSASRSRRRSEEGVSIPNFHQASDRCWLPISYYFRSTRVSLCKLVCFKDSSRWGKCQWKFRKKQHRLTVCERVQYTHHKTLLGGGALSLCLTSRKTGISVVISVKIERNSTRER